MRTAAGSERRFRTYFVGHLVNSLLPGEKPIYTARPHWIVVVPPVILSIPFGLLALASALASRSSVSRHDGRADTYARVAVFYLAIVVICWVVGFLQRVSTSLTVTNRRVIAQQGLWIRKTFEVPLSWLATITIEEGLLGRLLNYGTILLQGTGGSVERFRKIAGAVRVRRLIHEEWERAEPRN